MDKLEKCRICLAEDVRMHSIANTYLQDTYERLTAMPLETKDMRPLQVCYICCARLQNCHQLRARCLQSEEFFTQLLEKNCLIQTALKVTNTLKISQIINISNVTGTCENLGVAVKTEPVIISGDVQVKEEPTEENNMDQDVCAVYIKLEDINRTDDVSSEPKDLLIDDHTLVQVAENLTEDENDALCSVQAEEPQVDDPSKILDPMWKGIFKMSSDGDKKERQGDDDKAPFSDDDTSQNKIAEIKKRRRQAQNKIRCKRYRDKKKKKSEIVINKEQRSNEDVAEEIKRRKEYDKQKSQRYRDKKRASNLIKLHKDQSSKTMREERPKKPFYRYCIVPECNNTIRRTPDKIFFSVPRDAKMRKQWCKIMRRGNLSPTTCLYCCEDHFNVEEDTVNYIRYMIMKQHGEKVLLRLKEGVVPHIFRCQKRNVPSLERKSATKIKRLALINDALSTFDVKSKGDDRAKPNTAFRKSGL